MLKVTSPTGRLAEIDETKLNWLVLPSKPNKEVAVICFVEAPDRFQLLERDRVWQN